MHPQRPRRRQVQLRIVSDVEGVRRIRAQAVQRRQEELRIRLCDTVRGRKRD